MKFNIDNFLKEPSKNCIFESDLSTLVDESVMLGVSSIKFGSKFEINLNF